MSWYSLRRGLELPPHRPASREGDFKRPDRPRVSVELADTDLPHERMRPPNWPSPAVNAFAVVGNAPRDAQLQEHQEDSPGCPETRTANAVRIAPPGNCSKAIIAVRDSRFMQSYRAMLASHQEQMRDLKESTRTSIANLRASKQALEAEIRQHAESNAQLSRVIAEWKSRHESVAAKAQMSITRCKDKASKAAANALRSTSLVRNIVFALERSEAENSALRACISTLRLQKDADDELLYDERDWRQAANRLLTEELEVLHAEIHKLRLELMQREHDEQVFVHPPDTKLNIDATHDELSPKHHGRPQSAPARQAQLNASKHRAPPAPRLVKEMQSAVKTPQHITLAAKRPESDSIACAVQVRQIRGFAERPTRPATAPSSRIQPSPRTPFINEGALVSNQAIANAVVYEPSVEYAKPQVVVPVPSVAPSSTQLLLNREPSISPALSRSSPPHSVDSGAVIASPAQRNTSNRRHSRRLPRSAAKTGKGTINTNLRSRIRRCRPKSAR